MKQYGTDGKLGEVDFEILKVDFGWEYSTEVTTPTTRRRHASRAESIPSPASPASTRPTRRKAGKQTPIKKTRSGRTIKIPQVDGASDSEPETIPQFDGHNGPPQQNIPNYGTVPSSGGFFVADQQNQNTGPFTGVIPILMPPGRSFIFTSDFLHSALSELSKVPAKYYAVPSLIPILRPPTTLSLLRLSCRVPSIFETTDFFIARIQLFLTVDSNDFLLHLLIKSFESLAE